MGGVGCVIHASDVTADAIKYLVDRLGVTVLAVSVRRRVRQPGRAVAVVCLAAGLLAPYLMAANGIPLLDQAVTAIAPGWNAAASLALGGPLP